MNLSGAVTVCLECGTFDLSVATGCAHQRRAAVAALTPERSAMLAELRAVHAALHVVRTQLARLTLSLVEVTEPLVSHAAHEPPVEPASRTVEARRRRRRPLQCVVSSDGRPAAAQQLELLPGGEPSVLR